MAFIKDSSIYLSGEVLSKAIPFILIPYLSRKLGVDGYGELSYYQTYIALFVIFLGLSQDGAIARYFYFYGKRSLPLIVNSGVLYTISSGVLLIAIAGFFRSIILIYTILVAIFQSLLSAQFSIRQCQKRAGDYVYIQVFYSILSLVLTITFLEIFNTELVEKRILAILISNLLSFGFAYWIYNKRNKNRKNFNAKTYRLGVMYILSFGIPLVLHNMSFFIKGQIDRFFIYHQFSPNELGLYAMGANLASVFSILIMAVNKAGIPYYYEAIKRNRLTLKNIYRFVMISFFILPIPSLIILVVPESVFVFLLGYEYGEVKYFFAIF
ncbi:oligosaccharide flippase family protein, partial [Gallibacterium anatis]|uniref:oligosaccharide flippase family protein n=1 Tax=Gallibacterium anatis TaxID=750 RepID=UPI0039FD1EAE